MTHQEVKTYLILKYGSMSNAIDVYVMGDALDIGKDYDLMDEYFHAMIERINSDQVDKRKKVC